MRGPKHRSESDAVWDRKIGATLAFIRARETGQRQEVIAQQLGISRGHLASIESGRTPLTAGLGWKFCIEFDCHPGWICAAGNSNYANVFPGIEADVLAKIENFIKASSKTPFRKVWPLIGWRIGSPADSSKNILLTNKVDSLTSAEMQPVLPKLIERLKRATAERGKKSDLAKWLGVHRQSVTDWLSGKQEPGGEITLRMLRWVEQQER
ncbi:MAG TPA: helix-turn-helix transcriptional regulator [Verrucomicrobiae bacterium]|nr:helix-turn-helix transcriptional regulator [Verrucomicrobiae bacterium]